MEILPASGRGDGECADEGAIEGIEADFDALAGVFGWDGDVGEESGGAGAEIELRVLDPIAVVE